MSTDVTLGHGGEVRSHPVRSLPSTALAWTGVVLTAAIFPVAWTLMSHAIDWPVLDTWVAPVSLQLLITAAAITSLVAYIRQHQHSVLVLLALIVSVPLAVFANFWMLMEVLFPH